MIYSILQVPQAQTEYSGAITLTAGQKYDITLEYFEAGGQAAIILQWSSSCQPKQVYTFLLWFVFVDFYLQ